TFRCFWRSMTDGETTGTAGETTVSQQCARFAETFRFQVAGWIQHFLHAGAAARTFVANDHYVTRFDLVVEDRFHCAVLTFEDARRAAELEDALVNACGFHDAAVFSDVAVQHGQTTFLVVGVFNFADAAVFTVGVERRPARVLAERHLRWNTGRTRLEESLHFFA